MDTIAVLAEYLSRIPHRVSRAGPTDHRPYWRAWHSARSNLQRYRFARDVLVRRGAGHRFDRGSSSASCDDWPLCSIPARKSRGSGLSFLPVGRVAARSRLCGHTPHSIWIPALLFAGAIEIRALGSAIADVSVDAGIGPREIAKRGSDLA